MKKIRFFLSNKKEFLFDDIAAQAILDSQDQLVKIVKGGEWTGETLNKAHIIHTEVDKTETRRAITDKMEKDGRMLPEPEQKGYTGNVAKFRPSFMQGTSSGTN